MVMTVFKQLGYCGLVGLFALGWLTGCASSIPSNFEYISSVRGEQGWEGSGNRDRVVSSLLKGGVVKDPTIALQQALPDDEITVKKWGLRYFPKNWSRYQLRLDAEIQRDDTRVKCREVSTQNPVGAPTLPDLLVKDGALFQAEMEQLISRCVDQVRDLT